MKWLVVTIFIAAMAKAGMADPAAAEELLVAGNNQFTARMFSEVVKLNPGKSVVLSGFSVLSPLAQLAIAAEPATHDELLRSIGMPNDNATKEVFSLVNQKVRAIKGVELKMANRIYIPDGVQLNENYQKVSREIFDSDVKNVDFTKSEATATAINSWVEDQTNHRIKDLVSADSLTPNTRAVLVNAIYFKGKWQDPFNKDQTAPRDFHVSKDKTIQLPTMHRKGDYTYAESAELDAKLLRLPYEGGESSMLIILPNKIDGLAELEEKLKNPEALTKAMENMFTYEVDVYLPLFKIETTTNLKDVLMAMDVKRIFSSGDAQLNHLLKGESDLFVSDAIQKAFIEVNEEGAEAAAANAFRGLGAAPFKPPPKLFHANRPFYYEIVLSEYKIFSGAFYLFRCPNKKCRQDCEDTCP